MVREVLCAGRLCTLLLLGFAIPSVVIADDLNNLTVVLRDLAKPVPPAPSWRGSKVYEREIGPLRLVLVVGDATKSDVPNSAQGPMLTGNMLNQDADVVVDAANGDINPGSGVSGSLYAAAGSPSVDGVWRKNKPPFETGYQKGLDPKRLNDGDAWFNTNPDVIAYSPDKGTGTPQNIMRIIHAVAPVCGNQVNDHMRELLVSAYKKSLKEIDGWLQQSDWLGEWNKQRQAAGVPLRGADHRPTIVFPLLGAGVFRCDVKMVAESFQQAVTEYAGETKNTAIGVVILAPFNAALQKIVLGVLQSKV